MEKEKNLELDRLIFFSDAVIAIAITLLALNLRVVKAPDNEHITFADIGQEWRQFASFFLSFFLIAVFWVIHHKFFHFVRKVDQPLVWYNLLWLLSIVLLPFSTTLVSIDFNGKAALFTYSMNIFFITLFQNQIWDRVAVRPDYLVTDPEDKTILDYRVDCNIAMVNALLAVGVSFINPVLAFIILCTRPVMKYGYDRLFRRSRKIPDVSGHS